MKTDTTPVRMDTPHGPLYIAVMAARRERYHDSERGNVTKLRPFLRVATNPEFEADPTAADRWTIRGRAYGVHYEIFFEDHTAIEYANGYQGERWHCGDYVPYKGGFRNDRRGPVEFRTATFKAMWGATTGALDAFDAAHPGWQDLSRFLLLNHDAVSVNGKAGALRKEAAELDAEASRLRDESLDYYRTVPADTAALLPAKEN